MRTGSAMGGSPPFHRLKTPQLEAKKEDAKYRLSLIALSALDGAFGTMTVAIAGVCLARLDGADVNETPTSQDLSTIFAIAIASGLTKAYSYVRFKDLEKED